MSENLPACIIELHGVTITETGLVGEPLSEQRERQIETFLNRMERAISWCRGDRAVRYVHRAKRNDAAEGIKARDERHARQLELEHIAQYADMHGLRRDTVADSEQVARFFPHHMRRVELSFDHHAEAMHGCNGDSHVAADWLDQAIANAWTVSELRAAIRKANAQVQPEPAEPVESGIDRKIGEIELWAAKRLKNVQTVSPSEARGLLSSMRRLVELIETLTRRAHGE